MIIYKVLYILEIIENSLILKVLNLLKFFKKLAINYIVDVKISFVFKFLFITKLFILYFFTYYKFYNLLTKIK
jgi:hypothetical protein